MMFKAFSLLALMAMTTAAFPSPSPSSCSSHSKRGLIKDVLGAKLLDDSARVYNPTETAFDGVCSDVTIKTHGDAGDTVLRAVCKDDDGYPWETEMNLNRCIVNVKGMLQFFDNPGQFDDSCADCALFETETSSNLYFACACVDEVHEIHGSFLEFGGQDKLAVKPADGQLVCGTNMGTKEPPSYGLVKQQ